MSYTEEELAETLKQPDYSIREGNPVSSSGNRQGNIDSSNPVAGTSKYRALAMGISEEAFQQQIIEVAHLYGWLVAHFRKARTKHGWITPVAADGAGFPDLILVHPGRHKILAMEVKSRKGQVTPAQKAWQQVLGTCIDTTIVRPRNWNEIVEVLKS